MRKVPIAFVSMLVALLVPDVVHAQWLNYPSAGIPRTPDGKPHLSAEALMEERQEPFHQTRWAVAPN